MRRLEKVKECSVDGCAKAAATRGLCDLHRSRMRRLGGLNLPDRRGRVAQHPLYLMWNRLRRAGEICEQWKKFWAFADAVGAKPTRHHVLSKERQEEKYSETNFKWSLPVKVAFDANDPKARSNYNRLMRSKNPEYETRAFLKRYGITLEEYQGMLLRQNGVCAICSEPETVCRGNPPKPQRLSVDHDHNTGKVRGLLCVNCNKMLGHAHDELKKLESAISYLKEHK